MATVTFDQVGFQHSFEMLVGGDFGHIATEEGIDLPVIEFKQRFSANLINLNEPDDNTYRVVMVNMKGDVLAELERAVPGPINWSVTEINHFEFDLPMNDSKQEWVQVLRNEVQVYRGTRLLFWGVIVRTSTSDGFITAQCQDLMWYFTRRVIGRSPKRNLLSGGLDGPAVGRSDWKFTYLPRSKVKAPPNPSYSFDIKYNEYRSLALSSSVGMTTQTYANDDIYYAHGLTNAGKSALQPALYDSFGPSPIFTVRVFDDNALTRRESIKRAQNRGEAIADYIIELIPSATVKVSAFGSRRPKRRNNTAANREINRRTTITYRDDDGKAGAKQVAYQRLTVRNPRSNQKRTTYTFSVYAYLDNVAGYAAGYRGIEIVRADPSKRHPDVKWRNRGYKKPLKTVGQSISNDTPLNAWVRYEVTVILPNNGKRSELEVRMYVPNGDIYYAEMWLTSNESLWFKDAEQADIVREIIEHAQDEAMGKSDLNIKMNIPDTGVKRVREYLYSDRLQVWEALEEFPTLADGMEFSLDYTQTARTFTAHYPRKGRDIDVVLSSDSNVASHSVDVDGNEISTTVIVQSEAEGSSREERIVQDPSIMDGLVLEKAFTITPNSPAASWRKQAERGLARYRRPAVMPSVDLNPEYTTELLDNVVVGDRLYTVIRDEYQATAQKYRVTEMTLTPDTDTLSYSLFPEDINVRQLIGMGATGWRYKSQPQNPIVGATGTRPVESNKGWAARDFDDSSWQTGKAGIGWVKEATGNLIREARYLPATTVPKGHEVWMRKTVRCTGDMYINARVADWAYIYVNGHLLTGGYLGGYNWSAFGRPHLRVPLDWLDPSGVQVIAIHAQYHPKRYAAPIMDSLYADLSLRGSYDARMLG